MTWTTQTEMRDAPWDVSVNLTERKVSVAIGGRMFRFEMTREQLKLMLDDLSRAERVLDDLQEKWPTQQEDSSGE